MSCSINGSPSSRPGAPVTSPRAPQPVTQAAVQSGKASRMKTPAPETFVLVRPNDQMPALLAALPPAAERGRESELGWKEVLTLKEHHIEMPTAIGTSRQVKLPPPADVPQGDTVVESARGGRNRTSRRAACDLLQRFLKPSLQV